MSDDQDYIDPNAIASALDGGGGVTGEPVLAQIDDWGRVKVSDLLYETRIRDNPVTGELEKVIIKCNYPDLENASGYALSHHNLLMNYSWEESRSMIMAWRGVYLNPMRTKYKRDPKALAILMAQDQIFMRNVVGGSGSGSHQNFLAKLVSSIREVTVSRRTQE